MNKPLKTTFAALLAAAAWALAPQVFAAEGAKTMRGAEITAEDQAPDVKAYSGKKPGLQQKVARTFKEQPPVIPHAVDNFDEISLEENQCLGCHGPAKFKEKNAPKIGDSHFLNREGKKQADVSSLRHNCVQCHVPQVDAPPLVENSFKGNMAAKESGKKKN